MTWKAPVVLAALSAFTAFLFLTGRARTQSREKTAASAAEQGALWMVFGLKDKDRTAWSGELVLDSGRIVHIEGWRFLDPDVYRSSIPSPEGLQKDRVLFDPARDPRRANWECVTQRVPIPRRPDVSPPPDLPREWVRPVGALVTVEALGAARVKINTSQGGFSFALAELWRAGELQFLDGSVRIETVPATERVSEDEFENDYPSLAAGRNGELWIAWVAYRNGGDQIRLRGRSGEGWSQAMSVTEPGDHFGTAVGIDGRSRVWVVWSARVKENWDLYARSFDARQNRWGTTQRLTEDPGPDIFQRMVADRRGRLYLVWQGFRNGQSDIWLRVLDGERWSPPVRVSPEQANDWEPSIAVDERGKAWVAWDGYASGNYDVFLRSYQSGKLGEVLAVAPSPRYQARASVACDRQQRVWVAWEESGTNWGKDYGTLVGNKLMDMFYDQNPPNSPLYLSRSLKVAVLEGNRFYEPTGEISSLLTGKMSGRNGLPELAFDGQDRLWLVFRHLSPQWPGALGGGGLWESFAACYSGGAWSAPRFLPHSIGRNDGVLRTALGPGGQLWGVWATDARQFSRLQLSALPQHNDVFIGNLNGSSEQIPAQPPHLKLLAETPVTQNPAHPEEPENIRRVLSHRARIGEKTYRIYRGDLHRHTDISYDGGADGSLGDLYRYALDAARLDYILVTDHNAGGDQEYPWWRTEKYADLFFLPGVFVPLFGYERDLPYPNGHRNVVFPRRGIRTLPRSDAERRGEEGAARLYAYLRRNGGVAMSHTSATNQGTDWRDNDPELEPLVEIYQGARTSYEYEGAPKAATRENTRLQISGFQPSGFVWNAWAKGYRLGVQASSDHRSTHISYACLYAEALTREALLDAIRRRHSYGATDNIVVDFRIQDSDSGGHLMGDILTVQGRPRLFVHVAGTAPLERIDIVKNNSIIHTRRPDTKQEQFHYLDNDLRPGESYYYVRALQKDGQIAWSSPIWVTSR